MTVTKNNRNMKTIAIYTRVSTTQQTTLNQVLALERFATSMGFKFVVFEEVKSTRKTRPIKKQLLNDLRKKKYDGLLVYKLDRWARSCTELILEINELVNKGIEFYSYKENIDFTSPTGKLYFTILSAFAELEREFIRQRTLEGLARAKKQGKTLGRPRGSKDKSSRSKTGYLLRSIRMKSSPNNPPVKNRNVA